MLYIFDTSTLTVIFRHYYTDSFPSFWEKFNNLVSSAKICSVREVYNEIKNLNRDDELEHWVKLNKSFFSDPTHNELQFITKIYSVTHFQQNLEKKKLLHGGAFADPFIIAKAYAQKSTVLTQEKYKEHATKIPNICKHFNIPYIDLQGFLNKEKWKF